MAHDSDPHRVGVHRRAGRLWRRRGPELSAAPSNLQTLGLLEDGYLPLALTLSQAKATQSVYANLVERALESERSTPTKSWLRAALRIRPTTLQRAYEGVEKGREPGRGARAIGAASLGSARARRDCEGLRRDRRPSTSSSSTVTLSDEEAVEDLLTKLRSTEQRIERNYDRASQSVQQRISRTSALAAAQSERATFLLGPARPSCRCSSALR